MGLLENAWQEIEPGIIAAGISPPQRECMHITFLLGAKSMIDLLELTRDWPVDKRLELVDMAGAEWASFQDACRAYVRTLLGRGHG